MQTNQIYHMDCLEGLKQIRDGSVDLILTDPPYNEGYNYRNSTYIDQRDDYYYLLDQVLIEARRILRYGGAIYLKHSSRQICNLVLLLHKHFLYQNLIVWISHSIGHPKNNYDSFYEPIYFYSKGQLKTFNKKAELRKKPPNYWSGEGKEFVGLLNNCWYDIKKIHAGCLRKIEGGKTGNQKLHPCSMPLALAKRIINISSNEGDIIVDPFLGSGTTAVAAKSLGRRFMGFEISPEYCRIARKRLREIECKNKVMVV